ncbi:hypothetical protein [Pseudoclavibacter helvolus]|uniref:hypothetical protein n=1 Tax=Pseudoclavibacter helvolus TaxID=255205 RepID=UPI0008397607|nr:hypothetical protein [Pseudoclavibacter helvolus]
MKLKSLALARTTACAAVALIAVGGLVACAPARGDSAVGAAEGYLQALADGDAEQLAELSGLTADDPSIAALASATARITGPTIISPEPSATTAEGEEAQATLDVSYTLDGMLATTTLNVERDAGEGAPWLVAPPTEKVSAAGTSPLLGFTVGDAEGAVSETNLLPGVYPVAMTPSPYVSATADSITVQTESVTVEATFDDDAFEADANALIGPAAAECLKGDAPADAKVTCAGDWGAPDASTLPDGDLGMGPAYREIAAGEATSTTLGPLHLTGGPLTEMPTIALSDGTGITTTQSLTVTKNHPITKYSMIADLTVETIVTAEVHLDDAGAIDGVVLTGERSLTSNVRKT